MNKGALLAICGLIAAMSLAAFGCGDSSDEATASLTRDQYLAQGNAICKKGTEERGKGYQAAEAKLKPGKVLSKKEREELVLGVFITPYEKTIAGLEELEAPSGDEQEIAAIIKAMEEAQADVEANPLVGLHSTRQFFDVNAMVQKYGLKDCVV
ncbi:MAG TPA: hypothetical protein VKB23_13430 [Solirubrobacterales bacterium]|nr:hypothetical protein [Solirubrobacterales bacterium]